MTNKQVDPLATSALPDGKQEMREAVSDAMLRLLDRPIGDEALREATIRVSRSLETPNKDLCSLLAFRLGDEYFAVKAVEVDRVTDLASVRSIPHRSNVIFRGICSVDGEILLCASLGDLLSLSSDQTNARVECQNDTRRQMVVIGKAPEQWVFEVDETLGVIVIETASFKPPPVTVHQSADRFTQGLVPTEPGRLVSLLDVTLVIRGFEAALR